MPHHPAQTLVSLAATLAAAPVLAADATPLSSTEGNLVHFAFASQLGSGIYSIDGRTLQIYRLPFAWQVTEPEQGRPGVRLRLPATLGLFDFETDDLIEEGFPDQFDTMSLGLGIELEFPLGEKWDLLPYVEAGRAWQVGEGDDFTTYSTSLHARGEYQVRSSKLRLQAGALWAGIEDLLGRRGDFARLEAGAEWRWMLGFQVADEAADAGAYVLAEWYVDQPDVPVLMRSLPGEPSSRQFEVGITLGSEPPARIWRVPLPRIGVAWRFAGNLSVFRVVFGAAF